MNMTHDDLDMNFWAEEEKPPLNPSDYYKILIADDEEEVHRVTELVLDGFTFDDQKIKILHAYSGNETINILREQNDIAVLFLDVVMEHEQSGLDVVGVIRNTLNNKLLRIILRTGQPGQAPEEKVIKEYDINDYRLKTELTSIRLRTTLYSALKSYRDMSNLQKHKQGLEKIIESSARMFEHNDLNDFLASILNELANFNKSNSNMLYIRENQSFLNNGFITAEQNRRNKIVAATGKYKELIGKEIESLREFEEIARWIHTPHSDDDFIHSIKQGFTIESHGNSKLKNFIYIEGPKENFDYQLINLFLSSYSIALDNYILNNMLQETQKEILYTLGETIESHFEETGSHIRRLSAMMLEFAPLCDFTYGESEMLKLACTMHDLGKIAIPDLILKKPGRLNAEEFETMRTHASLGYKILQTSDLPALKLAAEIALNHHEHYDGSGYPKGLKGEEIPKSARMLAILDVFDAMTHKRVYKEAISVEETLEELNTQKNKHFDAKLVDIFINNIDRITSESKKL